MFWIACASLRPAALLLTALLTQGFLCAPPNPTQRTWPAYSAAVQKILDDHDLAMNAVAQIDISLTPQPGSNGALIATMKPDGAVVELEKTVIPQLRVVATSAASIQTPNSSRLTALHRPLAEALTGKADAYKIMCDAFKKRDSTEFDKGLAKLTQASNQLRAFRKEFGDAQMDGGPSE